MKEKNQNINNEKIVSTKPLSVLFTIVSNKKADYYVDLIQNYQVNMQMVVAANGTTKSTVFVDEVGSKSVIMSLIANENIERCLSELREKFSEIKGGKGVAYTVPLSSIAGVRFYNFLANNKSSFI
ncbi:MAG: hypothetical protein MJ151_02845 [Lachnospiraceae bacterium]|nr:hypothetical protein [Lachnospiraceae bacterium]